MKKASIAFLLFCLMISFVSCQSNAPSGSIKRVETKELYRVEGYESDFQYSIEVYGKKAWWDVEILGSPVFTEGAQFHILADSDKEAYLCEEDAYHIKETEHEFTSSQPLTPNEICALLKDYFLDEKDINIFLSDCIDGTYVFAILTTSYKLVPGFDVPEGLVMIGEAKSQEELSLLFAVECEKTLEGMYVGSMEGETFFCQQGEFRDYIYD